MMNNKRKGSPSNKPTKSSPRKRASTIFEDAGTKTNTTENSKMLEASSEVPVSPESKLIVSSPNSPNVPGTPEHLMPPSSPTMFKGSPSNKPIKSSPRKRAPTTFEDAGTKTNTTENSKMLGASSEVPVSPESKLIVSSPNSPSIPGTPEYLMPPCRATQDNATVVHPSMFKRPPTVPDSTHTKVALISDSIDAPNRTLSNREVAQRARRAQEKKDQGITIRENVQIVKDINVDVETDAKKPSNREMAQRIRRARERNSMGIVICDTTDSIPVSNNDRSIHINMDVAAQKTMQVDSDAPNRTLSNREVAQRARRAREKMDQGQDINVDPETDVNQDRVAIPNMNVEKGSNTFDNSIFLKQDGKGKRKMIDENTLEAKTPSNREMAQRIRRARERNSIGIVICDTTESVPVSNNDMEIHINMDGAAQKTMQVDSVAMHKDPLSNQEIGQRKRRSREKKEKRVLFVVNNMTRHIQNVDHQPFPTGDATTSTRGLNNNSLNQLSDEENNVLNDISDAFIEDVLDEDEYADILQQSPGTHVVVERHYLGPMNIPCKYCSALHWEAELLSKGSISNPLFGQCCLQGKIKVEPLAPLPPPLKALYEGTDQRSTSFRKYIREYNAANAFTSLGAKMDDRVMNYHGPTSFTIHGELRHQTGALLPDPGNSAKYAQLYIYDPATALHQRCHNNQRLSRDVMQIIQDTLWQSNPFRKLYRSAYEILQQNACIGEVNNLSAYLHYRAGTDRRRYNLPSSDEIAIIMPGETSELTASRDIILRLRGGQALARIHECHPAYLPLHYVLFFPNGELGWSDDLKQFDVIHNKRTNDRLTHREYFAYRLFQRLSEYPTILFGGKLFQEFVVDAWAADDQNRLLWVKLNQGRVRAEIYKSLTDIADEGISGNDVGKKYILPTSHTGSSRYMYAIFQDSMAITRYNKHPDIFLTMTANPNWPEILEALGPFQNAALRPDVVARVFQLKKKALLDEIYENGIFGRVVAHVYTIEFQKRGLPHMHALIFLHPTDKIRTVAQVDQHISAEFPDPTINPILFQTVKKCMVHGPCGVRNPNAPCMDNGKCTKYYPRKFTNETTMDGDGYPVYRRRDTGKSWKTSKGQYVDNRDVVPYNPYLSERFNCHINVEVCASVRAVKYIHKYIYKGHDRTTMILQRDEIKQYIDARYIGPIEAVWRLLKFSLHQEIPSVKRLALHLPGEHLVTFDEREQIRNVVSRAANQRSTLTAFFDYYAANIGAREYTYLEFPEHFVIDPRTKMWHPRSSGFQIGRIFAANPNEGERFYLRLLLTIVKGPRSYECLRTVNGICYPTFKAACGALGLLEDDSEWIQCLTEAATTHTGHRLRRLFSVILLNCSPLEPALLWQMFSNNICDDIHPRLRNMYNIMNASSDEVIDYGLYLLDEILQQSGKTLADFPTMPLPKINWSQATGNRLIREQLELNYDGQEADAASNVSRLNMEQLYAYNEVISSVVNNKGTVFFLSGPAGTGKTFLYNTIASTCRSAGSIVIMVASSGIASLLLVGGRTAHSTFKIPLDITEDSNCGFTKQSARAELFREAKLIIWDEITMQHKYCVEAVDRTLRDIRCNGNPFGGLTVVLGGDFQQILPVIPKGVREQIVGASLRRSYLWNHIVVLSLVQNMRLDMSDSENINFAQFLTEVANTSNEIVQLPSGINYQKNLSQLVLSVYPHLNEEGAISLNYLNERIILSPRNDDVAVINQLALDLFPGETIIRVSADKLVEADIQRATNAYPSEYLNELNPSGLPPFKLQLKVGCPVILLRNIAPKDGLCNGTRLMIVRIGQRIIDARILTGEKSGELVAIPRISLQPTTSELPFSMSRRQFPLRLAYAMTINKAQGQSVKYVGIDLRTPIFSHGQLYVALSRCTSTRRISILLPSNTDKQTTNIVYPEVLLN